MDTKEPSQGGKLAAKPATKLLKAKPAKKQAPPDVQTLIDRIEGRANDFYTLSKTAPNYATVSATLLHFADCLREKPKLAQTPPVVKKRPVE